MRGPAVQPMVWTSWPDVRGTDRVYLGALGGVEGLRFSHDRNGSKALSCTLKVGSRFSHRALNPGRDIGVTVGMLDVWLGELQDPQVGDDGFRSITGIGEAGLVGNFVALGLASHNAMNANEVIDAARLSGRHSRWRRVDDLGTPEGMFARDGSMMLDETLTTVANAAGKTWRVDRDRIIRFYPQAGDGTFYSLRSRADVGRTTDGLVTRLDGAWIDALTGLYRVEHVDASPALTGATWYPSFYTPDDTAYAQRTFTLYTDGTTVWAYVMQKPAIATYMSLQTDLAPIDLALVEQSQFLSKFEGPGYLFPGGRDIHATYHAGPPEGGYSVAFPAIAEGDQDGYVHVGPNSLAATGIRSPREEVVDLIQQGSFTQAEALPMLREALTKKNKAGNYTGAFVASRGDLRTKAGRAVDLASVQAGCVVDIQSIDPTRNVTLAGDDPQILMSEVEYDADTDTLSLTPYAGDAETEPPPRIIDPVTGLYR